MPDMDAKDKREIMRGINEKRKAGTLPPQSCASCGQSLADPSVPEDYRFAEELFTLAMQARTADSPVVWVCPFCLCPAVGGKVKAHG